MFGSLLAGSLPGIVMGRFVSVRVPECRAVAAPSWVFARDLLGHATDC
jgi:hypothetical protein